MWALLLLLPVALAPAGCNGHSIADDSTVDGNMPWNHDHTHHDTLGRAFSCGSSHPDFVKPAEVTIAQDYHTEATLRQLQTQHYPMASGNKFLSLAIADAAGLSANLRVKFLWTPLDGSDYTGINSGANAQQCTSVGATIAVGCVLGGSPTCSMVCTASDVVVPGNDRYNLIKSRVSWAGDYYSQAVRLKPVLDSVVIDASIIQAYTLPVSSVANVDLVIIVTARPSPNAPVAAYASCLQRDQYGRCTVGQFNWVPSALEPLQQYSLPSIDSERHTAVHEIMHVLGGINPGPTFIDANGNPQTGVFVTVASQSADYPIPVTYITTPKVRRR